MSNIVIKKPECARCGCDILQIGVGEEWQAEDPFTEEILQGPEHLIAICILCKQSLDLD